MATFSGLGSGKSHPFVVTRIGDIDLTAIDEAGKPLKEWYFVLIAADGVKKKGRLDGSGKTKVQGLVVGPAQLSITEDKPASFDDAPPPPPPAPPPPPPPPSQQPPPPPGKGTVSEVRTDQVPKGVTELKPPAPAPLPPNDNYEQPTAAWVYHLSAVFVDRLALGPAANLPFRVMGKEGTTGGDGAAHVEKLPRKAVKVVFAGGEALVPTVHDPGIVTIVRLRFLEPGGTGTPPPARDENAQVTRPANLYPGGAPGNGPSDAVVAPEPEQIGPSGTAGES